MKKIFFSIVLFFAAAVLLNISFAKENNMPNFFKTQKIQITENSISQDALKNRSKMWNLTVKEFKRYLQLMQNTPSGKWYKKLDPAEVLALNADSPYEMMKYAKIQAKNTHERVTRELLFDKLYSQAYRSLYPNEKPIKPHVKHFTLKPNDRMWLFIRTNTPLSGFIYQHLIKIVQKTPHTVLDIYFIGDHSNTQSIQKWAAENGITPQMANHQITLNINKNRFQSITQNKPVHLPYIGILHNKHFQPVSLSSVL